MTTRDKQSYLKVRELKLAKRKIFCMIATCGKEATMRLFTREGVPTQTKYCEYHFENWAIPQHLVTESNKNRWRNMQ